MIDGCVSPHRLRRLAAKSYCLFTGVTNSDIVLSIGLIQGGDGPTRIRRPTGSWSAAERLIQSLPREPRVLVFQTSQCQIKGAPHLKVLSSRFAATGERRKRIRSVRN
jgi:hypothetical protein